MGEDGEYDLESFPYPVTISRDDFQDKDAEDFDVDSFLYKKHRFTSIDLLRKELSGLLKDLNQELLDLVNQEYGNFIKLGRSIEGSLELLHKVQIELQSFNRSLLATKGNFIKSEHIIQEGLEKYTYLSSLKVKLQVFLLLGDQLSNFERLLSWSSIDSMEKLKKLTAIFLSINQLHLHVQEDSAFTNLHLKDKILSLQLEFRGYLDETLSSTISTIPKNPSLLFELMKVYKVTGNEEDFICIVKQRNK